MTHNHEDGNALAGPLLDVFAFEVSTATARCAGCTRTEPIVALHVYQGGPGVVARCPGCGDVLLRYAETPHGRWLDLRGTAVLHFGAATG